jgi:hypothetical protein
MNGDINCTGVGVRQQDTHGDARRVARQHYLFDLQGTLGRLFATTNSVLKSCDAYSELIDAQRVGWKTELRWRCHICGLCITIMLSAS